MVKHLDLSVKIFANYIVVGVLALWSFDRVDQADALPHVIPLDWILALHVERDTLRYLGLTDSYPILVDFLNNNRLEVSTPVRAKHHLLIDFDGSFLHHSSKDQTEIFCHPICIYDDLCCDLRL